MHVFLSNPSTFLLFGGILETIKKNEFNTFKRGTPVEKIALQEKRGGY